MSEAFVSIPVRAAAAATAQPGAPASAVQPGAPSSPGQPVAPSPPFPLGLRSSAAQPGSPSPALQPAGSPSPAALDRQALHAAAADRLRDLIIEGVLAPGARLNERVLAAHLGVSRTPLREAFKVLAGEGLVALLPNRGAMVVALSRADIEHTFELMAALEALSGELAARRVTDAELAEVRALHYEMLAAHARRDLPAYYRINLAIHRLINAAARNPVLAETYRNVNARIQSLRFRSNLNRDKWDAAVREHAEMIEALAARDGARLAAVLRRHLENKRDVVLAQMETSPR